MTDNQFAYNLLDFMQSLHNCHLCKYPIEQINGRGKKRTYCDKFKIPIRKIRENCIDRFPGFSIEEIKNITKQYRTGKAELYAGRYAI